MTSEHFAQLGLIFINDVSVDCGVNLERMLQGGLTPTETSYIILLFLIHVP